MARATEETQFFRRLARRATRMVQTLEVKLQPARDFGPAILAPVPFPPLPAISG